MTKKIYSLLAFLIFSLAVGRADEKVFMPGRCWARTPCWDGRVIACEVYADPYYGQSCAWRTIPFREVECRGWDLFGNWVVLYDRCW